MVRDIPAEDWHDDETGETEKITRVAMNTYHDRYARFGVVISILVGVTVLVASNPASYRRTYPQPLVQAVQLGALIEAGYLDSDYGADGVLPDGVSLNELLRQVDANRQGSIRSR